MLDTAVILAENHSRHVRNGRGWLGVRDDFRVRRDERRSIPRASSRTSKPQCRSPCAAMSWRNIGPQHLFWIRSEVNPANQLRPKTLA